jgi:hypothetical protein
LLFLAAIADADPDQARQHLDAGLKLWDGTGFKDRVAEKRRQFATYKLALALIAAARLNITPEPKAAIMERLLAQQDKNGGWITDYDLQKKPVGLSNVETTCLAISALDVLVKAG